MAIQLPDDMNTEYMYCDTQVHCTNKTWFLVGDHTGTMNQTTKQKCLNGSCKTNAKSAQDLSLSNEQITHMNLATKAQCQQT